MVIVGTHVCPAAVAVKCGWIAAIDTLRRCQQVVITIFRVNKSWVYVYVAITPVNGAIIIGDNTVLATLQV